MGLAGLGAFAGGVSQGISRGYDVGSRYKTMKNSEDFNKDLVGIIGGDPDTINGIAKKYGWKIPGAQNNPTGAPAVQNDIQAMNKVNPPGPATMAPPAAAPGLSDAVAGY